ncbi:probable metalloprotease, partial [Thalassiosira pseudonana CCMP1335]
NVTKSHMDKKLYRYVTLSNGLQCVLIYDDDGLRKAATALLVNVGSYHDPPHLQGLSHFLEHMLFLGTKDYPGDNEYDAFLSQHGGDDNAYTDMEHTLYHYCIPQDGGDGEKSVWKALKMFSSFFTVPLLGGEQAERELNAVESEFELNKCDDDCRLSQLMSETLSSSSSSSTQQSKPFHPFAKFPWGNMASLKEEPERDGVDVMKELREHYNTHYFAKNMRLVVMAGYELDELQKRVVQYFSDVPSDPRVSHPKSSNNASGTTNLDEYKLPFHPSSLAKIYRIIPVHHRHSLTLTWQIPSMCSHWRTKPHDYLAHLLGHEASGSILSALKQRGLAMGCSAGVGDDGLGDASTHALFRFQVTLSRLGVKQWEEVVEVVFAYIGMLRYVDENNNKVEGLAPWIYEELKSIAGLSYRFADEGDVTDIVEEIAENMAPWYSLPKEHVLEGDDLLFGDVVDNSTVKDLLFNYFKPEQTRFDLMSSLFGAGLHSTEARFGTKYWSESISPVILQQWSEVSMPQLPPSELQLDLPPKNPFIPSVFDLKPLPDDDAEHPLLNLHDKYSLKLWHLQDRKFKRPVVDLRLRIECDGMNDSALNQGCVDLFCRLCADALVETCYLASTSELGSSISPTESGFSLRIHGFDHKLLDLTKVVLDGDLPATINDGRFDACLESLLRRYRNAGMEVSGFCTSLRILCLRSTMKSAFVKLKAMEGIDVATFTKVMNTLLKKISIDALYHGNVDRSDADIAAKLIHDAMTRNCTHVGIPKKNLPTKLVTMVKLSVEHHQIISPSIDPKDPNTAVEVYFQVSKDNVLNRVLVDLIAHILEEPLYCQIRTKEQFGYQVSCGARWTFGVIGLSFQVVTACKSAEEASNRIDTFLQQFRSELASMDNTTYLEHLAGLAKNKLEMFDSLEDECSSHWSEIVERRYDWEAHRAEVLTLRCISREKLLHAYDEWFNPVCSTGQPNKRRKMVIHVI